MNLLTHAADCPPQEDAYAPSSCMVECIQGLLLQFNTQLCMSNCKVQRPSVRISTRISGSKGRYQISCNLYMDTIKFWGRIMGRAPTKSGLHHIGSWGKGVVSGGEIEQIVFNNLLKVYQDPLIQHQLQLDQPQRWLDCKGKWHILLFLVWLGEWDVGCDGVFHTASPVAVEVSDPQAELIDPALRGTINILRSCAKVPSVKRVVVTSSMATVVFNGKSLTPDMLVDESWFSNPLLLEQSKLWYMLSKTLAEEAAWKFAKENGIDMVTLNPGWVIGPLSHPTPSLSVQEVLKLIKGLLLLSFEMIPHVLLTHGRPADDKPYVPAFQVSQEKAKGLGIHFTPLEVSLKDTIESLKENNLISF
ncbi:hypothetical protein AAG906_033378 [Vitis piasezkii]